MVYENNAKLTEAICLAKAETLENSEFCHRSVERFLGKSENEQYRSSLDTFATDF